MAAGPRPEQTSASKSPLEPFMKSIARIVFALTAVAACTAAVAQPYSPSDQERRERNREELMARYGEPQPDAARTYDNDRHSTLRDKTHHVAEKTREKTHNVAEKTRNFTHRQAQKMRNFGDRQNERFGKAPEHSPERTGQ
jgi:hypothetical protein